MDSLREPRLFTWRTADIERRLFRTTDLSETLIIGLSAFAVRTRPIEAWAGIADRLGPLDLIQRRARLRVFRDRVTAFFGPKTDHASAASLLDRFHAGRRRYRIHAAAERILPDYRPDIVFEGRDVLDRARQHGNGVILWYDNFRYAPLVGARSIAEAGYECWLLSSVYHGPSSSKVGRVLVNPSQRRPEARYLAGRIDIDASTVVKATRQITGMLAANQIVYMANNVSTGRQGVFVPIGASAWTPVATTPLNFARTCGAQLLPVAVIEQEPFRRYRVTVGEPLSVFGGDKETALCEAAMRYAAYLEPLVEKYPDQWMPWAGRRSRMRVSERELV